MDCESKSSFRAFLVDLSERQETIVVLSTVAMPIVAKIKRVHGDYITVRKMDYDEESESLKFSLVHLPMLVIAGIEQTESIHNEKEELVNENANGLQTGRRNLDPGQSEHFAGKQNRNQT